MDDIDMEDTDKAGRKPQPSSSKAPTLSKSWAISRTHVPTFTGGKVSHCRTAGLATTENEEEHRAFLLLPVHGDLAIVDAQRGTSLCSVRGSLSEDDPDDDEVDMDAITSHALSYNDQILMTCSHNNIVRQYALGKISSAADVVAKGIVALTKNWGKSGHTLPVNLMQFHISNVFVATGSVDGSVRVFDVRGGFVTHVYRPFQSVDGGGSGRLSVTGLEWMPDIQNLVIAVGRDDGSVAIHNLREEKELILLHDHVSAVTNLQWALPLDTTKLFVTAGRDSVINLWKIEPASKKKKSKDSKTTKLKYKRVQTLPIYESVEGMLVLPPKPGQPEVVVATAGGKGRVRLWSSSVDSPSLTLMSEQPLLESFGEARGGYARLVSNGFRKQSVGADFDEQLVVADSEHNISFLSLKEDNRLATVRTVVGHNDDILDLKVIPNANEGGPDELLVARRIVVATNSAQVRIFDLATFSCHVLDKHTATVLCVDVSPCGRYIATCGKDREMRIWHVGSFKCVAVARGHAEAVGSTAFSRQVGRYDVKGKAAVNGGGAFAVTVSVDRTLKRWNLPGSEALDEATAATTGEEISLKSTTSARAHEKDINVVSVAPNDSLIATGSQDKTVKLWKATDLTLQATLSGHRRGVWDCQFSPHDRVLATASGDRTVKVWSLGDYSCVRTFQGHTSSVLRVRFLCFGLQLASSGADGLLKVWTIRTSECETTLDAHTNKAWALDLAPGGKTMVSGGADSRIVVWTDTTQAEEEAKHAEKEEAMMLDQKLANHLRHKEYRQALEITLELDKPHQALRVFSAIIECDVEGGSNGIGPLQSLVRAWSKDKVLRVLKYCREWNTRSRNAHVALLILRAIVSVIPVHDLAAIEGVPEIMAGIMPYAERHFERLDRLHESSFLIDFVLTSMGNLEADYSSDDFAKWEATAKLVLPPVTSDGRVQVGGRTIVGRGGGGPTTTPPKLTNEDGDEEDDVMTIGESSSSDEDDADDDSLKNSASDAEVEPPTAVAASDNSDSS